MKDHREIVKRTAERYLRQRGASTVVTVHQYGNELTISCHRASSRFRRIMREGGLGEGVLNRLHRTCVAMAGRWPGYSIGGITDGKSRDLRRYSAQREYGYSDGWS